MQLHNSASTMAFSGATDANVSFGLWVYYDPPEGADGTLPEPTGITFELRLGNTAVDFTNSLRLLKYAYEWIPGWNYLEFYCDDVTYSGNGFFDGMGTRTVTGTGVDWGSPIRGFKLYVTTPPSGAKFYLDSLDFAPYSKPCVILGGDSWTTDWDTLVLPHFQAKGFPFYIATGPATNWDATKTNRAYQYQDSGVEFLNHTINHLDMADLDYETIVTELTTVRDSFEDKGLTEALDIYAAPFNSTDALVDQALNDLGFTCSRVYGPHWTKPTKFGVPNPHRMACQGTSNQTLQFCKDIVDGAILHGNAAWFFFETIIEGGDGVNPTGVALQTYENDLISLLDYIDEFKKRGVLEVLSPSEFRKQYITGSIPDHVRWRGLRNGSWRN